MKAGSATKCSDRLVHRLIRSLRCAPFPAFIEVIMTTIEQQLSALQPARQTELARRILEIPRRRRQRRRDCVVGLAGLLTGIATTLLVVMLLHGTSEGNLADSSFADKGSQPTAGRLSAVLRTEIPPDDVVAAPSRLPPTLPPGGRQPTLNTIETNIAGPDPIDLDALIARYEKLLRNRRETANRFVVTTPILPSTMPDGVSPWEYRKKLLEELGG